MESYHMEYSFNEPRFSPAAGTGVLGEGQARPV